MTEKFFEGPTTAYWNAEAKKATYSPLTENLSVDVAILGAGISGLCGGIVWKKRGTVHVIGRGSMPPGGLSRGLRTPILNR